MIIKTNRLFNFFNRNTYNSYYVICIFVILLIEFILTVIRDNFLVALIILLFTSALLFGLLVFIMLSCFPKEILVDENCIEYSMRLYEKAQSGISPIVTRPHRFKRYTNVSNSEIKEIIYKSNKIEKLFNTGHIQINAKTYITDKDGKPFYIFNTAPATLIYGIKDFKNVKIKLREALPNTKHIEK